MSQLARTGLVLAGIAAVSVLGGLVASAALGMSASETGHVAALLVPAGLATVVAAVVAARALAGASLQTRLVAVALVAIVVALANLAVLAMDMVVSGDDAKRLAILLVYALGAGVAVAVALSRTISPSFRRLKDTATALGEGNLDARVGDLGSGPELETLAGTLDEMAGRLQAAEAHRDKIEAMRRDLITAVSHDLRTPLASLRGMVEAIDDGVVDDPASLIRYAAEMRGSVEQLSTMVDDLFELTQLDAGAIERETKVARLDEIVRSAMASVEPEMHAKRLSVEADLGPAAEVTCSPRMTRVLQNLLMNAVRHTPTDGAVRVSARRNGQLLEVAVEDSGEGIAPQDLDRVFEPFYRADPARSGPGAGLGLALAKRIVEALGGRISAENALTHGARFAVVLPLT
jgi:two-component system, OmpR family, sensor histidine kinase SaeS